MKKIVLANLKNYLNYHEVVEYAKNINNVKGDVNLIICPSTINIGMFNPINYHLGCQNIHYVDKTCTGETLVAQLKDQSINYVIVGHSERRGYNLDTDDIVNKKLKLVIDNNITPILCIGETMDERSNDKTKEVLKNQITQAFTGITDYNKILIAYEPVWSIHPYPPAKKEEIEDIIEWLYTYLNKTYHYEPNILYGGSVNSSNILEFDSVPYIKGYLIGKASTKIEELQKIVNLLVK